MSEIIIMRASPFDASITTTMAMPDGPDGAGPDGSNDAVTLYGGTTDIYACAGIPGGYTTTPADNPPSTYIPAVMTQALTYSLRLYSDVDMLHPGGSAGAGVLGFSDPKGELDHWLDYAWDGRDIKLLRGDSAAAFSTFSEVVRLTSDGIQESSPTHKKLRLLDLGWKLATPLPIPRYAGTGGAEGGPELAGTRKPFLIGVGRRVPCVLIDAANLIYQYHHPALGGVMRANDAIVYVGGAAWTSGTTSGAYEGLLGATVAAGTVMLSADACMFRLGSAPPQGQEVRVDGFGMRDDFGSAALQQTLFDLVFFGAPLLGLPSNVANILVTPSDAPGGWLIPAGPSLPPSLGEVLTAICYGAGWHWWTSLETGQLFIRALVDPAGQTADIEIDCSRPYVLATEPALAMPVPRASTVMRHDRYWAPESRAAIAGTVGDDVAQDLGRDWREATDSRAVTAGVRHRSARVAAYASPFVTWGGVNGAIDRARDLGELFERQRFIVTARFADLDPFSRPIGQIVELQNLNRFGFGAAKKFLCIGVEVDTARRNGVTLVLWG